MFLPRLTLRSIRVAPLLALLAAPVVAADAPVALHWLGGAAPATDAVVSWGVPWPKGKIQKSDALALRSADGKSLPVQTWPMAYWPDGSLKWTGHAASLDANLNGPFTITPGQPAAAAARVTASEDANGITIDTGGVRARLLKQGNAIVDSLTVANQVVAQNGRLIVRREDRSAYTTQGIIREEAFNGRVTKLTLEQSGPVRAVVKIEGVHRGLTGPREWLPFTLRLYFFAGSGQIRVVHSWIFDGDAATDFIKGLGLAFDVPFREELHNRHLRFVGDGDGVWAQPVRMLPGYRTQTGQEIATLSPPHLAGQRVPNVANLSAGSQAALQTMPIWGDAKLTQLGPNSFSIHKRTTDAGAWLHVTDGHRARGLALIGDVSGGIAVALKNFWQKYPSSIELTGGAQPVGQIKLWFWSPAADAMDLRHYDTGPHGLSTNYEDWKPGWSTPLGVANTSDLTLWAFGAIPANEQLVAMAQTASEPPMLVCTPEYYHAQTVFGHWALPNRTSPAARWVEDQVNGLVDFYRKQVDERSWYGFWDFGDIMHNYDFGRHEWRYDVGGWAWANTELMPDMVLWYTFLRSGRSDIFRMAEAMTRQTSEVDVHHIGPFAPLGSRHNVSHWGDGAKQPRISHAGLKQFYYFLTTDERVGDLMREQIDADLTFSYLQQFNGSHYVPNADGSPRLDARANPAPRPEQFAARPTTHVVSTQLNLEWMCYAMNWAMEAQRTGEPLWHDRITADMRTMAAKIGPDGQLPGRYFDMLFGGPENMFELEPMFDVPAFWNGWVAATAAIGRQVNGGQMTAPRLLAYAAHAKNDKALGLLAWEKLIGNSLPPLNTPARIANANVVKPVTDPSFIGDPVGWQLHGVASIHWALNALETLDLAGPWLADWEAAHLDLKKVAP